MTLESVLFWMFAGSTAVTVGKDIAAKHKIERMGFKVNPDNRSILEIASSFIKDYFFLLIPVVNVVKAIKKFIKNDTEYANERLQKLEERERISSAVKEEPKKEKVEVVKEESKKETVEKVKEEPKKQVVNMEENLEDNFRREELLRYYYDMDKKLRVRHQKLISMNKIKEANEVATKIIEVDSRYKNLLKTKNKQLILK